MRLFHPIQFSAALFVALLANGCCRQFAPVGTNLPANDFVVVEIPAFIYHGRNELTILQTANGKLTRPRFEFAESTGYLRAAAISGDGALFINSREGDDPRLDPGRILDLNSMRITAETPMLALGAAWNRRSDRLAVVFQDTELHLKVFDQGLHELSTFTIQVASLDSLQQRAIVGWSPDERAVAISAVDGLNGDPHPSGCIVSVVTGEFFSVALADVLFVGDNELAASSVIPGVDADAPSAGYFRLSGEHVTDVCPLPQSLHVLATSPRNGVALVAEKLIFGKPIGPGLPLQELPIRLWDTQLHDTEAYGSTCSDIGPVFEPGDRYEVFRRSDLTGSFWASVLD